MSPTRRLRTPSARRSAATSRSRRRPQSLSYHAPRAAGSVVRRKYPPTEHCSIPLSLPDGDRAGGRHPVAYTPAPSGGVVWVLACDPPERPRPPSRDDPPWWDPHRLRSPAPARWAASCAEHVLDRFESARPQDPRPRQSIEQARAWAGGEITMSQARAAGGHAMAAARDLTGAARHAAYAAGQAAVVAHVAAHELGEAAYAIKAARAAAPPGEGESAGRLECRWQREQLPDAIRELVLDDQRLRNDICWWGSRRLTGLSRPTARRPMSCRGRVAKGSW